MRMDPDPAGTLTPDGIARGVSELRGGGAVVFHRPPARGLELVVQADDADRARHDATVACVRAFGTAPEVSSVTFVSRGTDEDALGVVQAFGVSARLERIVEDGEEVVVVTLARADRGRVPEGRLATALEAALNREVRIEFG